MSELEIKRSPVSTFFYFKGRGALPRELRGEFTSLDIAQDALALYQARSRANAEKNSSQVRKAKARANTNAANTAE